MRLRRGLRVTEETDAVPGAPHPRLTRALVGQGAAEAVFLASLAQGRMPHAWLVTGPRGIGKATLAWRIARFLLATPQDAPLPATLDIDPDTPVARRMSALSESRLLLVRRGADDKTGRARAVITVDEVRRIQQFFALAAPDGGRRVVVVDAACEMNPNAANALLKVLEEPPADATLLLVCHQPARLLPTIRSRCRELRCRPLDAADLAVALAPLGLDAAAPALAELSAGSVGAAVPLAAEDGVAAYGEIVRLFAEHPRVDRRKMTALAESAGGRDAEARFDLLANLLDRFLARLARAGATGEAPTEAAPGEAAVLARLAPDAAVGRIWAEAQQSLGARLRAGRALNLDPAALLLDMLIAMSAPLAGVAT